MFTHGGVLLFLDNRLFIVTRPRTEGVLIRTSRTGEDQIWVRMGGREGAVILIEMEHNSSSRTAGDRDVARKDWLDIVEGGDGPWSEGSEGPTGSVSPSVRAKWPGERSAYFSRTDLEPTTAPM